MILIDLSVVMHANSTVETDSQCHHCAEEEDGFKGAVTDLNVPRTEHCGNIIADVCIAFYQLIKNLALYCGLNNKLLNIN